MTKSTHKLSILVLGQAIRIGMFPLLLCFGAGAVLAQTTGYVTNTNDNTSIR